MCACVCVCIHICVCVRRVWVLCVCVVCVCMRMRVCEGVRVCLSVCCVCVGLRSSSIQKGVFGLDTGGIALENGRLWSAPQPPLEARIVTHTG